MATSIPHGLIGVKWLLDAILAATGGRRRLLASHMDGWGLRVFCQL